ncbi:7029_t:CDS:2 [Paraglomus occultum]|uniref:7029_t:CDS:1 n=1 Tax=Paraglomus occultum TaxID=144539 RepID=A0A9N9FFW5_9GLOM|nr:7029_t:CDS:2 [Paraglomus occultum]
MGSPDSKTSLVKHRHDTNRSYQSIACSDEKPGLSSWELILLTLNMAGIQFTWTVELSYGTPYLLHLGLSKNQVALVWLAGPLSGLLIQPLVGAFSDRTTSRLGRRRPYIIIGGLLMERMGRFRAYGEYTKCGSEGDLRTSIAIWIAVVAFYFLDFSLNAVMASCRALILDIPPLWQQDLGNAWAGRMIHIGNVVGFTAGFIDWIGYFPLLGDSQLKVLCSIAIFVLVLSLLVTCLSVKEEVHVNIDENVEPWYCTLVSIYRAFRYLPVPVQRICNVQFFAWMGWFPFLFYSTTWIRDIHVTNNPDKGNAYEEGTRYGSLALLIYSIISVIAGVILPQLTNTVATTYNQVTIYNIYTASHIMFALSMLATYFVGDVPQAMVVLASVGIPWAASMWIPYALVGEFVATKDEKAITANADVRPIDNHDIEQVIAESSSSASENTLLPSLDEEIITKDENSRMEIARQRLHDGEGDEGVAGDVGIVLRFGGLMALVAAFLSRYLVHIPISGR